MVYWSGVVMMRMNRKAAENVVASLILFIAVMALATATTVVFKNYLDKSSSAVNEQQSRSVDVMRTNFFIPIVTYDGVDTTRAYVKNTGSTRFDPQDMDVYIDGIRVPRDPANRNVTVVSDTDTINTGIWDPGEELEIEIYQTFGNSQTRTLLVTAPNGVSAREEFSS